jgi:hypothetical protein
MPTPYIMHPQLQGAFDRTLGRPEMLALTACALVLRELESSDSDNESDSDSDSDDPTEELALSAIVALHISRRLRASAALDLGTGGPWRHCCSGGVQPRLPTRSPC